MLESAFFTAEIVLVSPLVLGGFDSRKLDMLGGDTPWLRTPSLKPQLRFWFRALAGPVLGYDPARLWELEKKIWGSTNAAGICVETRATSPVQKRKAYLLPHRDGERDASPVDALWADPPPRFAIRLSPAWSHTDREKEAAARGVVHATCSVWSRFGGLGKRSRRGFGSFDLLRTRGFDESETQYAPPTTGDVLRWSLSETFGSGREAVERAAKAFRVEAGSPGGEFFAIDEPGRMYVGVEPWDAGPFDKRERGPIHNIMRVCHLLRQQDRHRYEQEVGAGKPRRPSWLALRLTRTTGGKVLPVGVYGRPDAAPPFVRKLLADLKMEPVA